MFKNNYQGGAVVEIFCAQGKDPVAKWKLSGGTIHKEYNKEIKGFVYCLEGSSQTVKMQMPRNGKMSLGLLQRFLVFQVNVPHGRDFSIELMVTDTAHLKRRLYLSTVHKELSTTLWHAKIPLVGLSHKIWSTLCIDLVSFTSKLFRDVAFVSLDGITVFANCSIRRMFTMKAEPEAGDEMFLGGGGLMEWIPRSCHFPQDIKHIAQVLNIENMKKSDTKTGRMAANSVVIDMNSAYYSNQLHSSSLNSGTRLGKNWAPEQTTSVAPTRPSLHPKGRPPGVFPSATGPRVLGPRPQSEVKNRVTSEAVESRALCTSNTGSPCYKLNQKSKAKNQSYSSQHEKHSGRDCSPSLREVQCIGTAGILQPHPPRTGDKTGLKIPRVFSPGKPKLISDMPDSPKKMDNPKPCAPSCSAQGSRLQALSLIGETELRAADKHISGMGEESPSAPARGESESTMPCDLQVCSSWDSNEEPEPQLTTQQPVFTFSSQPHTPRQRQGRGPYYPEHSEENMEDLEGQDTRRGAQPEDDFFGSESDEGELYSTCLQQKSTTDSGLGASRGSDETLDEIFVQSQSPSKESGNNSSISTPITKAEPPAFAPKRCLSPPRCLSRPEIMKPNVIVNSSVSLSRRLVQEVQLVHRRGDKDEEDEAVESYGGDPHALGSVQLHQDEEELRMLASLKREQEAEASAVALSDSQIHQCHVSLSISSDDTSTWTHTAMMQPDHQGHHYQKEMKPLLSSNPREWMDVLSPPIMAPGQRRRSESTWDNREDLIEEADKCVIEENEEEYLNLLYDPCLNCYFDPKSGKYYELA